MSSKSLVVFTNDRDSAVDVAIEPWAMLERLEPGQRIQIDLPKDQPHETAVDITLEASGSVTISASYVQWTDDAWQVSFGRSATIHLPDRVEHFEC